MPRCGQPSRFAIQRQEYEPAAWLACRVSGVPRTQALACPLPRSDPREIDSWHCRAQGVCLNTSMCDLGLQLHFALFNGSQGCVLKPLGMRDMPMVPADKATTSPSSRGSCLNESPSSGTLRKKSTDSNLRRGTEQIRGWSIEQLRAKGHHSTEQIRDAEEVPQQDVDTFWPPPCHTLQRTTLECLSLHHLPKVRHFPVHCV